MPVGNTQHERGVEGASRPDAGHWACGLVGGVLTAFVVFLAYSTLVAIVSVVPLLSTTALVLGAVVLWVVLWLAIDVSRHRLLSWNAGRS